MSDNFMVFNAAEAIQYADCVKGTFLMEVVIPTDPTAGDSRRFGLYSKNRDVGIYFQITGTTFQAVARDGNKSKEVTTAITYDSSWTNQLVEYKIIWEAGRAEFYVNRVPRATVAFDDDDMALAVHPLSLYVQNENSDNLLVGAIEGRNVYQYK